MRAAPAAYGLPHGAQGGAMEREMKALLLRTCAALADAGCIKARRHRPCAAGACFVLCTRMRAR
jgi:hypothetical protein